MQGAAHGSGGVIPPYLFRRRHKGQRAHVPVTGVGKAVAFAQRVFAKDGDGVGLARFQRGGAYGIRWLSGFAVLAISKVAISLTSSVLACCFASPSSDSHTLFANKNLSV